MPPFAARIAARLVFGALLSAPAAAQMAGHGSLLLPPAPERPLHQRLALADAAAVATVASVDAGRVRVRDAAALFGAPAASFEIKRSPSRPPPLVAGDRVLLLLRGARAPYVAVDEPRETRTFRDRAAEERWTRALGELRERLDSPERLEELYRAWLDAPDADLRHSAAVALGDPGAPFQPLGDAALAQLARGCVDPSWDARGRLAAAVALAGSEDGRERLLAALPGSGEAGDPAVLTLALRVGGLARQAGTADTFRRSLAHPSAALRRAALRAGGPAAYAPGERAAIEALAHGDPDPDVRSAAERVLARWRRAAGS